MDEAQFQQEAYLLRQREWPYYLEAHKAEIKAVPDLSDQSGGLSEPLYFNFISYIAWKVVARHVAGPDARTAFNKAAGETRLKLLWPEGLAQAQAAAKAGGGQASEAAMVQIITTMLRQLQQGGYCCSYQVVWGEQPGGWPQDWMTSQATLEGLPPAEDAPAPPGLDFQVKVHLPADLLGSVALRSEEEGFWSRSISYMLLPLLAAAGYKVAPASVSEYFYQDQWVGPASVTDQMLLLLGDPLEQVGIDFNPTTLVQNWQLQ